MLKKVKKLLSCILAVSMISATAVIPVTAEGETTQNTSLYGAYYSNDFESYTGKLFEALVTAGAENGWTKISNQYALVKYTNTDGTAAISPYVAADSESSGQTNWDYTFKDTLTTGTLYISYDFMTEVATEDATSNPAQVRFTYTDEVTNEETNEVTEESVNKYLQFMNSSSGIIQTRKKLAAESQGTALYQKTMTPGEYNHIDIAYDLDAKTVQYSIDGTVVATEELSESYPVEMVTWVMYPDYVIDNLKIAHRAGDNFEAEVSNVASRSFDIEFSETVNPSLLTASNIVVKDASGNTVPVKSVTADYDSVAVKLENKLASEANYTVELKNITNVFGNALTNSTLSFKTPVIIQDYVLYEYDFENYTGNYFYGTDTKWANKYPQNSTQYTDDNDNTWMKIKSGSNKWSGYTYTVADDTTVGVKTGKIAYSFDLQKGASTASDTGTYANSYMQYNTTAGKTARIATLSHETNKIFLGSNTNNTSYQLTENVPVKVDVVVDLDNDNFKLAIDGNVISNLDYDVDGELQALYFRFYDGTAIDNLKIAYMDEESFEAEISSVGENSFDIAFGETLAAAALTADNVTVKDASGKEVEVKSVTKTADTATVTVAGSFVSEASYNVTLNNVKNFEGTALFNTEFTVTAPTIPERKTLLSLDTPEEFAALGLVGFEGYTGDDGVTGAKFNHSVTEVEGGYSSTYAKAEGENVISSISDNRYISLNEKAYAIGDITYEMKVFVEASTAIDATSVSGVMFTPKLVADKGTTQLPYVNNQYYSYQNQAERIDGSHAFVSKTDQRGSWHTYKTVLHTDTKTADIYIDGTLINTYKFNNYNGLAASGYYTDLRLDYNVGAVNDGKVYENIPYVLIDYIKVTQEYVPNETGLYVLLNEVQEYGDIGTRTGWFTAAGISAGEELRTVAYVLNLTGEAISGYSLAAVYNDGQMTTNGGSQVSAENGEVLGGAIELTVADVENMEIKGFLWDSNLSPLTDAAVADSTLVETEATTE